MVFMGEEWAASTPWQFFTDFEEPELADAVREGRRGEFAEHGWDAEEVPDPQDERTREASVLRWDEVTEAGHARMLRWYTSLVGLRRTEPDLADDRLDHVQVHEGEEPTPWLRMHRGGLRVVVNAAADTQVVPLDGDGQQAVVVLTWDPATTRRVPGGVELGGHGVAVLRVP